MGFLGGSAVKNPPATQETWIQPLGWMDPLEKGMVITLVFLPGEFRGQKSLAGYSPWSNKESDSIEWLALCCYVKWVQLSGSLNILWHRLSLGLEWKLTFSCLVENWPFPVEICWHIECNTFRASSFRISNSSPEIPSPPLALFVVMLPDAHLTSHSRMSGSR